MRFPDSWLEAEAIKMKFNIDDPVKITHRKRADGSMIDGVVRSRREVSKGTWHYLVRFADPKLGEKHVEHWIAEHLLERV